MLLLLTNCFKKDVPSWTEGNKPYKHESRKDSAKRLIEERYGKVKYLTGSGSDYNKLKKYADRSFY